MSGLLGAPELRFINLVASRRLHGADPATPGDVEAALASAQSTGGAHRRAASLVAAVLREGVFPSAAAETAVLGLMCQLRRDGFDLVAPQGAVVGMVQGLAAARLAPDDFARWLEDRATPIISSRGWPRE